MGETEWDPWNHLRAHHPDVVVFVQELRGGVRACVDVRRRTIWLDIHQSEVEQRCALAFELAVLEANDLSPQDPCAAACLEREAKDWAARQLIPIEALAFACHGALSIAHVAERLGVTPGLLRARHRGLTDAEQDLIFATLRNSRAVH